MQPCSSTAEPTQQTAAELRRTPATGTRSRRTAPIPPYQRVRRAHKQAHPAFRRPCPTLSHLEVILTSVMLVGVCRREHCCFFEVPSASVPSSLRVPRLPPPSITPALPPSLHHPPALSSSLPSTVRVGDSDAISARGAHPAERQAPSTYSIDFTRAHPGPDLLRVPRRAPDGPPSSPPGQPAPSSAPVGLRRLRPEHARRHRRTPPPPPPPPSSR